MSFEPNIMQRMMLQEMMERFNKARSAFVAGDDVERALSLIKQGFSHDFAAHFAGVTPLQLFIQLNRRKA
jgi:hypothetical protein